MADHILWGSFGRVIAGAPREHRVGSGTAGGMEAPRSRGLSIVGETKFIPKVALICFWSRVPCSLLIVGAANLAFLCSTLNHQPASLQEVHCHYHPLPLCLRGPERVT